MNNYESAQAVLHILDVVIRLGVVLGVYFLARKKVLTVLEHRKAPRKMNVTHKISRKCEFVKGEVR